MDYRDRIKTLGAALERPLSAGAAESLARFAEEVALWNRKMNLTAARKPTALVEVLFADAVVLADEDVVPRDANILDVGSGAGAPAIPLALLREDVSLTLVEPLHKRVAFMRHTIGKLGLGGRVQVLERKLAPGDEDLEGAPFSLAMSRATLAPADWLALGLEHAPRVLVLTAAQDPPKAPDGVNVSPSHAVSYTLPSTSATRTITAYERA